MKNRNLYIFLYLLVAIININININVSAQDLTQVYKSDESIRDQATQYNSNYEEFLLNLTDFPLIESANNILIFGIPYMGNYSSKGYDFKKRLGLIILPNDRALDYVPESIKNEISKALEVNPKQIKQALSDKDLIISSVVLGTLSNLEHSSTTNNTYNLIYHGWVGNWPQNKRGLNFMKFYDYNISLGVFDPVNVEKSPPKIHPVAFNELTKQRVNWHAPEHLSPNNARITIPDNTAFSKFWVLALSPDKKHISITLFLIANNIQAEEYLKKIFNRSNNLEKLSQNIYKSFNNNLWLLDEDKKVLRSWIHLIIDIASPKIDLESFKELNIHPEPIKPPHKPKAKLINKRINKTTKKEEEDIETAIALSLYDEYMEKQKQIALDEEFALSLQNQDLY